MFYTTLVFNTGDALTLRFANRRAAETAFYFYTQNDTVLFAIYGEIGCTYINQYVKPD